MATKPAEKIIDALTQLMEGFGELQEAIESDFSDEDSDTDLEDNPDLNSEIDAAIVNEVRAALEAVIDTEDYAPEELASLLSSLTEALEEIDPDVFEGGEEDAELVYEDAEDGDDAYYDEDADYGDDEFEDLDEEDDDDDDDEDDDDEDDDEEEDFEDDEEYEDDDE